MKYAMLMSCVVCASATGVPQLTAYSIGGGGEVAGGTLTMSFTIGQYDAAAVGLASGTFEMCGGYWPGFASVICPADFNRDSAVDFFDYLDFVDAFSSGVTEADFNHDGSIDFFDYLDFVDAFSIGC